MSDWSRGWSPRSAYEAFRRSSGMFPTRDGQEIRLGSSSPSLYMVPGDEVPERCAGCGAPLRGYGVDSPAAGWICAIDCPGFEPEQLAASDLVPFSETGLDAPS